MSCSKWLICIAFLYIGSAVFSVFFHAYCLRLLVFLRGVCYANELRHTISFSKLLKNRRLTNLRGVKIWTIWATHWIACHTDCAYHHAPHTIWFIFYVYSISGFCFSFWSSQVTPLAWKATWLTHVCVRCIHYPSVESTHVHQQFLFESILAVAPLCILNSILDRFGSMHTFNRKRAKPSLIWIYHQEQQPVCIVMCIEYVKFLGNFHLLRMFWNLTDIALILLGQITQFPIPFIRITFYHFDVSSPVIFFCCTWFQVKHNITMI